MRGGGGGTPAITFIGSTDQITNGITQTYTSHSIGTASSDRLVVVGIASQCSSNATISGLTIGGVSATLVANAADLRLPVAMFSLLVTSGTTADIVATYSSSQNTSTIGVWTITGLSSTTAHDTGSSLALPPTDTLDIPAGGVAIGVAGQNDSTGTFSWTGLTEDYDQQPESLISSGASDLFASQQTGLTITATPTSADTDIGLCIASWR